MTVGNPVPNAPATVGRNNPCPCGSGKKFKHCCERKAQGAASPSPGHALGPGVGARVDALLARAKALWDADRRDEAIPVFAQIVRLAPGSANAHHDLGMCLLLCGHLIRATDSLKRAVELQPGFTRARVNLAKALAQSGNGKEAAAIHRDLSASAAAPSDRARHAVLALAVEGEVDEAAALLRSAPAALQEDVELRALIAERLALSGRFDEARRELGRCLDSAPNTFGQFATVTRMTEADRPLIERMLAVVERPGLTIDNRIVIRFGLGKAFDDLGDAAEAMRHYDIANGLRARRTRLTPEARAAMTRWFDKVVATFSAATMAEAAKAAERPERPGDDLPVLIVGMPRSGTTLVEQILAAHPAISAGGELPFWGTRRREMGIEFGDLPSPAALAKAGDDYRALLRRIDAKALRVTDKEPRNFDRLELIRLACPQARIIHCRRHPIDTCLSIYFANFPAQNGYAFDRGDIAFVYREYERLMAHWREVLPADRFTEVQYETLVADRERETRRLIGFLGLDWDDACLRHEGNRGVVRTSSLWQARQPIYTTSVERWRRYEPWLGELKALAPAGPES
ncbi:tetratricopeptide repeat protein [Roseiarcus fermentans]|uniref:Tetratricopeptide repeat protein n=1 Tax=Roseiarcus fermentans TaxID=1473586 RepID=A0A366EG93_9HYPH|nr:sulfotransferase [Roseiarcus fermentans]RBP01036.1 tetratricopeptide repeat protein [Roseiarcus fermentans]